MTLKYFCLYACLWVGLLGTVFPPTLSAQRSSQNQSSPNRNRTSGKFCSEEINVWQEAGWETVEGKKYWSPAQWVRKKVEFPCDKRPNVNTPPPTPPNPPSDPVYSVGACVQPTLDPVSFQNALESVRKANFNDTKLTVAKQVIQNNCLLTPQVKDLIREFSFEESRLEIAKYAYDFTCDKQNYFQINEVFQFETTIAQLDQYLKSKPSPNSTTPPPFQAGGKNTCPRPMMDETAFRQLMQQVKNSTSDATRLSLAKQGITPFCVSAEQVKQVSKELYQEINRLSFLKSAYAYTYDTQNYIIVHEALNNNTSKQELSKYVQQQHQNR